uniref:CHAD domain-containing protein n=1 Tax=Actinotalea sp. TaxID=1872145 RepID=UPI0035646935
ATGLRDGLKETATTWGEARDLEVQLELLLAGAATLPAPLAERAGRAVGESLRAKERVALDRAASVLSSPRHVELLVALVDAAVAPRLTERANAPIAEVVPDLLAHTLRRARRATQSLQLDGRPGDWHRARVLAKRARYAAEMVTPVLPAARKPATHLARLTDLLGRVQDGVVGRSLLGEIAQLSAGRTAAALEVQAGRHEVAQLDARRAVLDEWPLIAPHLRRAPLVR